MSVPNQLKIQIATRRPWGNRQDKKKDTFARIHIDAAKLARQHLKGESFAFWFAINSWADDSSFDLSFAYMRDDWNFTESTYKRAKKELMELGYLVPVKPGSNVYLCYEVPKNFLDASVQNEPDSNENREGQNEPTTVQNEPHAVQNEPQPVQNEQRNTTNTTDTTIYTTDLAAAPQKITLKKAKELLAAEQTEECWIDWANGQLCFSSGKTYILEG